MKFGAQTLMVWLLFGAGSMQALADRSLEPPIIPAPASLELTGGAFTVDEATRIVVPDDPRVASIAHYFGELLFRARAIRPAIVQAENRGAPKKVIQFTLQQTPGTTDPESYRLEISGQGVLVSARDPRGLFYGATTLWQILASDASGGNSVRIPALRIVDTPRLRWRGLTLDSAHQYQSVEFIKRFLDSMALHKLNILHWHLTDDAAWRVEIRKYPKLTTRDAAGYYSQRDIADIVTYAAERNITVVPGISLPAHAGAMIAAYPHLGAPAAGGNTRLLNAEETTFAVIGDVLTELVQLFPAEYVHIGGASYSLQPWQASADVQARMRELGIDNESGLQTYFVGRVATLARERNRKLIGWDQFSNTGTPQQTIGMTMRGIDGALGLAAAGYDVVTSSDALDFSRPQISTPGGEQAVLTQDVYAIDPAPVALGAEDLRHLMGVHATVWTERARSEADVMLMTYPRAAALAEIAWSPVSRQRWADFASTLPVPMKRYARIGLSYDDAPYRVSITLRATDESRDRARVELSRQIPAGEIRYTTNGTEPTSKSPVYKDLLNLPVPVTIKAATFIDAEPLSSTTTFEITSGSILSARTGK